MCDLLVCFHSIGAQLLDDLVSSISSPTLTDCSTNSIVRVPQTSVCLDGLGNMCNITTANAQDEAMNNKKKVCMVSRWKLANQEQGNDSDIGEDSDSDIDNNAATDVEFEAEDLDENQNGNKYKGKHGCCRLQVIDTKGKSGDRY